MNLPNRADVLYYQVLHLRVISIILPNLIIIFSIDKRGWSTDVPEERNCIFPISLFRNPRPRQKAHWASAGSHPSPTSANPNSAATAHSPQLSPTSPQLVYCQWFPYLLFFINAVRHASHISSKRFILTALAGVGVPSSADFVRVTFPHTIVNRWFPAVLLIILLCFLVSC